MKNFLNFKANFTALLALGVLSGCSAEMIVGAAPATQAEKDAMAPYFSSKEALRNFMSGSTRKTHNRSHGTQIEYFADDGIAYLWYPGNRRAVPSLWKTESYGRGEYVRICFMYSPQSYNPVTREYGGYWDCRSADLFLYLSDEVVKGDPFDLESGGVPFVMPSNTNVSIQAAMQNSGLNSTISENMVVWDWRE
ncbi:hypothetical protein ACMA5I_00615 [Paracoccaceae bacterium GXU_MW_L88]